MVHLATRTRLLDHHLQHKKRAFNAPLPISTAAEYATKLITASIKSPLKTNILLFQFCITIASCATQFFFNANQLVVFCHTVGAAH